MGIFNSILAKLGFGEAKEAKEEPSDAGISGSTPAPPTAAEPAEPAPTVKPLSQVDVVAQLEQLAGSHAEKLNWKTSIVDLLKLLGLDSSLTARKELANELHCPADKMNDSAEMNMWLHKTVLQKLAENGGNIPADLLH
jgi:hypothetical protein